MRATKRCSKQSATAATGTEFQVIVVDASAVVDLLVAPDSSSDLIDRLAEADEVMAPQVIDLEFLQALRRLVRLGELGLDRAVDARRDFGELNVSRIAHEPLADRIWALRDNLSAYDAAYVALAEIASVPLVTSDAALAGAPGLHAAIELYEPA